MKRYFIILFLSFFVIFANAQMVNFFNLGSERCQWKFNFKNNSYPAIVPGTIHDDLFKNKLIPDPFYADNEKKVQWVEEQDWVYSTTFTLDPKQMAYRHIDLMADGLDTYADVFINGTLVLSAFNMFRHYEADVKKLINSGLNEIKVVFHPAAKIAKEKAKELSYTLPGEERVFVRKAPFQFGWDWAPRLVTCGIWRPIRLRLWNEAYINDVSYEIETLDSVKSLVNLSIEVISDDEQECNLVVKGTNYGRALELPVNYKLQKGTNKITVPINIDKPQLWWCNGLGAANLYGFGVLLNCNKKIIQRTTRQVGLRKIELVQTPDKGGTSFYFKLNGHTVFAKGANYVPENSLLNYRNSFNENLIQMVADANMNMLRVWGGGTYADDNFYDACDKKGIMVWQDFMFACAMYPGDSAFLNNVKYEVYDNVRRLRNHPSVVLWCGNNENSEGWHNWGWQKQYQYSSADSTKIWKDYEKLFYELIPSVLKDMDDSRPYWPSSPSTGWGRKESLTRGDLHYWGVWWGKEPFSMYEKKVGRFVSEYGFQALPSLETLKYCVNEKDLNINSPALKNHQKHPVGFETIAQYSDWYYKTPKDFNSYVYVSQLIQAKGMQTAMEAHRRAKPYCMGSLYWQLNDAWPSISWSSIDFSGNPKAAHYQAKRSFDPFLISFYKTETRTEIWLVSDFTIPVTGLLKVEICDFSGNILWSKEKPINMEPNTSGNCFSIENDSLKRFSLEKSYLKCTFNGSVNRQAVFFIMEPKLLKLEKPKIEIQIKGNEVELSTDKLAKNILLSDDKSALIFEDNYFDLIPGERRIVRFTDKSGNNTAGTVYKINVRSLIDTY